MHPHVVTSPMVTREQVTGQQAERWLQECRYPYQRRRSEKRVAELAEALDGGYWQDSVISFHSLLPERSVRFLTDGQHRLEAIVRTGQAAPLTVLDLPAPDMEAIKTAYDTIDVGRPRSFTDSLVGSALDDAGLGVRWCRYSLAAGRLVQAGWDSSLSRIVMKRRAHRQNQELVLSWLPEINAYREIIAGSTERITDILRSPSFFSVALVTLRHQPEQARRFFGRLARNSGLQYGEPEWMLLERASRPRWAGEGDPCYRARLVASAWNAAWEGRSLHVLKAGADSPLRLSGLSLRA